jgi:hypothetical protein
MAVGSAGEAVQSSPLQAHEYLPPGDWWLDFSSAESEDRAELSSWPEEEIRQPALGMLVVLVFVVCFWSLAGLLVASLL